MTPARLPHTRSYESSVATKSAKPAETRIHATTAKSEPGVMKRQRGWSTSGPR
jgi:hypothetical protein